MRPLVFCVLSAQCDGFLEGYLDLPFHKMSTKLGFAAKHPDLGGGIGKGGGDVAPCLALPTKGHVVRKDNRDVPVEAVGHHLKTTAHRGLFFLMHLLNCIRQPQISSLIY